MVEPFISQFRRLVRAGASVQDIHDAGGHTGFASGDATVTAAYVEREVSRVRTHQRSMCPLIEKYVEAAENVLDVGCNTGGSLVAVALSPIIRPRRSIGIDPNVRAIEVARVRARGHPLDDKTVSFLQTKPGERLPFPDGHFDLTVCVSVLEFVSTLEGRFQRVGEMRRVTRPGGHIYFATPNPYRLRQLHSRVFFGDFRRRDGFPCSSTPRQLRAMFEGCERIPVGEYVGREISERLTRRGLPVPKSLARAIVHLSPWQKVLVRVPVRSGN
jgi:SAM-dependent methyltransferase